VVTPHQRVVTIEPSQWTGCLALLGDKGIHSLYCNYFVAFDVLARDVVLLRASGYSSVLANGKGPETLVSAEDIPAFVHNITGA